MWCCALGEECSFWPKCNAYIFTIIIYRIVIYMGRGRGCVSVLTICHSGDSDGGGQGSADSALTGNDLLCVVYVPDY